MTEKEKIKAWLKTRSKHVTGFCNEHGKPGQHEGQKPKDWRGNPMPTCEFWDTCPCLCHYRIDQMFEMTKLPRRLMPNAEYVPVKAHFVLPEVADNPLAEPAVSDDGVIAPPTVERPVAVPHGDVRPPLAVRRTETGRAARGGLEAQVWDACNVLMETPGNEDPITPKMVAEWIVEKYKVPTPSSGAVNAVWDRWTNLGYSRQAKKPNRFLEFTGDGTWEELVRMKGAIKRQKRIAEITVRPRAR